MNSLFKLLVHVEPPSAEAVNLLIKCPRCFRHMF